MRYSKQTKKIAKSVKETSGFCLPDIQDIYTHLVYHITQELLEKGEITLSGLGTISIKKPYKRKFYSAIYQREVEVEYAPSVSIKAAAPLRNALMEKYQNEQAEEVFTTDDKR